MQKTYSVFIRKIYRQKLEFLDFGRTFQGVSTGSRDQKKCKKIWLQFYQVNFRKSHKISRRSKKAFRSYYKKIDVEGLVAPPPPPPTGLGRVKSLEAYILCG